MASLASLTLLQPSTTVFLLCDLQENFRSHIAHFDAITASTVRLLQAATILGIPVIVTEQNPKALGHTVAELLPLLPAGTAAIPKTQFSMLTPAVIAAIAAAQPKAVVLFGIEAHICVLQTALALSDQYHVHVVADAVSSRNQADRLYAFERLRQSGVFITTTESVLYQLIGDSLHPAFKAISKLIRAGHTGAGLCQSSPAVATPSL